MNLPSTDPDTPHPPAETSKGEGTHPSSASGTGCERVLVAIATYNELATLPELVRQVREIVPGADVLIVDDNSPDGTGDWVARQASLDSRIMGIHRPGKLGLGTATLASLRYAMEHDYTYVVALDADGSHDPKYIPSLLNAIRRPGEDAPDMVIGSRYVAGGGTLGWPLHRRVMSRAVNWLARTMLGLPVRDCSGAFRCTRVDLLRHLDFDSFRSQGYSLFEELLWRCKHASARFEEVPIVFSDRSEGQSKISARESLGAIWMLMRLGIENWTRASKHRLAGHRRIS
ncbi:MAG: polyprenol monophosphomannose synthase [Pirellulaceae bacterium]